MSAKQSSADKSPLEWALELYELAPCALEQEQHELILAEVKRLRAELESLFGAIKEIAKRVPDALPGDDYLNLAMHAMDFARARGWHPEAALAQETREAPRDRFLFLDKDDPEPRVMDRSTGSWLTTAQWKAFDAGLRSAPKEEK